MYNLLVWSAPDYDLRDYKDYWLVENEVQKLIDYFKENMENLVIEMNK